MALTQTGTDGIKDDAITLAKQAAGTDGQIITYDASGNPVAVGPGTDGQVLTSTGAGSPPAFEAIPTPVDATKTTLTGSTNNTITTVTGANAIQGEANLTFDGTILEISNATPKLKLTDSDATGTPEAMVDGSGGDLYLEVDKDDEKGSSRFGIKVDGSEKLRIDSSGMSKFTRGSGGTVGHFYANARESNILIQNDARTWKIVNYDYGNNGTDHLGFHDGTTDRVIIQNTGGISFNGDTASANALDDYETGSWTPTLTRSGADATVSYNFQSGKYTKIGNLVMMWFDINVASESGGSGGWRLSVPFTFAVGGSHGGYGAANFRDSSLFGRLNMADASSYIDSTYLGLAYVNSSGNEVSAVSTGSGRLTGMTWAYTS